MSNLDTVQTSAKALIDLMVDGADVTVTEEEGVYYVSIQSEEHAPSVIGRHGETIRAIQKVLEVVLFNRLGEPAQLVVNVNDYREKQKERLEYIAKEHAERALDSQAPSYMRGFSSFERKIMHEFVTDNYPDLKSYSVGEGRDRRLVVSLKDDEEVE